MNKATPASLVLGGFEGIDNSTSDIGRPVNTWEQLENFDLYLPGAIRKTKGLVQYPDEDTFFSSPFVAIFNYRRTPADDSKIIGLAQDGSIYDIENNLLLDTFGVTLPFEAWYAIQQATVVSGGPEKLVNWIIVNDVDGYMWAWDGESVIERVGHGISNTGHGWLGLMLGVNYVAYTNDEQRGQGIVVHRKYAITFYNPITKHETSPTTDSDYRSQDLTKRWTNTIGPNSIPQQPNYPFVGWVMCLLHIWPVGNYTHFKLYATRDGGSELYLCTNVAAHSPAENKWYGPDADGAMPIFDAPFNVMDGVSRPEDANTDEYFVSSVYNVASGEPTDVTLVGFDDPTDPATGNIAESFMTPDSLLVTPAPYYGANDPPPLARWGTSYRGRLWIVDKDIRAKLNFSKPGEFWSWPSDNYIVVDSDSYDDIVSLKAQADQLLILKDRSAVRLVGVDFSDFTILPIQQASGIVAKRGVLETPTGLITFSQPGLSLWSGDSISVIGREIIDITSAIYGLQLQYICTAYFSSQQAALIAYIDQSEAKSKIIMIQLGREHPFSIYNPFETFWSVNTMAEVEDRANNKIILASCFTLCNTGAVYRLFAEDTDTAAVAETQWLPIDKLPNRKLFKYLRVEGTIDDWVLEYKTDKFDWQPVVPYTLLYKNPLGVIGNRIKLRLTNTSATGAELSNMQVDYIDMGERR